MFVRCRYENAGGLAAAHAGSGSDPRDASQMGAIIIRPRRSGRLSSATTPRGTPLNVVPGDTCTSAPEDWLTGGQSASHGRGWRSVPLQKRLACSSLGGFHGGSDLSSLRLFHLTHLIRGGNQGRSAATSGNQQQSR